MFIKSKGGKLKLSNQYVCHSATKRAMDSRWFPFLLHRQCDPERIFHNAAAAEASVSDYLTSLELARQLSASRRWPLASWRLECLRQHRRQHSKRKEFGSSSHTDCSEETADLPEKSVVESLTLPAWDRPRALCMYQQRCLDLCIVCSLRRRNFI